MDTHFLYAVLSLILICMLVYVSIRVETLSAQVALLNLYQDQTEPMIVDMYHEYLGNQPVVFAPEDDSAAQRSRTEPPEGGDARGAEFTP